MSVVGGIIGAIVVLLVVALAGWVGFTQIRARRLGVSIERIASCGGFQTATEVDADTLYSKCLHAANLPHLLPDWIDRALSHLPSSTFVTRLTYVLPVASSIVRIIFAMA